VKEAATASIGAAVQLGDVLIVLLLIVWLLRGHIG
jgi:hypothetical protein